MMKRGNKKKTEEKPLNPSEKVERKKNLEYRIAALRKIINYFSNDKINY